MLHIILMHLDLVFGLTKKARDAKRDSEWNGLPPTLNYLGGSQLKGEHLVPEFHSGKPEGILLGSFKVARVCDDGSLDIREEQAYDEHDDVWKDCFGKTTRMRDPDEIWMLKSEYIAASARAIQRAFGS